MNLDRFITLTNGSAYNPDAKREYQLLGRRILRHLVKEIGLPKGSYDIRWNPGGIAVSGDHTLHTDKFYLALDDNLGLGSFYWRTCNGRKDYSGGPNQNVRWATLKEKGLGWLATTLRQVQFGDNAMRFDPNTIPAAVEQPAERKPRRRSTPKPTEAPPDPVADMGDTTLYCLLFMDGKIEQMPEARRLWADYWHTHGTKKNFRELISKFHRDIWLPHIQTAAPEPQPAKSLEPAPTEAPEQVVPAPQPLMVVFVTDPPPKPAAPAAPLHTEPAVASTAGNYLNSRPWLRRFTRQNHD